MKKINFILTFILFAVVFTACKKDDPVELFPDAGISFKDIENEGYQVQLTAQAAPDGITGSWHVYVGENGSFDDINNPKTIFRGEPGVSYVLGWELSSGDNYKAATISVSFKALNPHIYSKVVDTTFNNHSVYLQAEDPKFGAEGLWEIIDGNGGKILNPTDGVAHFVGEPYTYYKTRWTLTYGSQSASKEYEFTTDELAAFAGDDNLDVRNDGEHFKFHTLEAFLPAGSTGEWKLIDGSDGLVLDPTDPHSVFKGLADTTYALTWTVYLEDLVSTDTVYIQFRGKWGTWIDPLDGQTYRYCEIGNLEWMAENYNGVYDPGYSSWIYGHADRSVVFAGYPLESDEDRKRHGRLYTYWGAVGATPEGWRLPTYDEWDEMQVILGGATYASAQIREGGSAGLDLLMSGYYEQFSYDDPALRNAFNYMEDPTQDSTYVALGVYWSNDYLEAQGAALAKSFGSFEGLGLVRVSPDRYGFSVRYVREVQ